MKENNVTDKKHIDFSIHEYIEKLSSKDPVPGGGGTAALVGALGVALSQMVGSLTEDKIGYENVHEDVKHIKELLEEKQAELSVLVDKDVIVFSSLSDAYRIVASTESEKIEKKLKIQSAIKNAALIPLQVMKVCGEAILLNQKMANIGNKLALSDAGCSALLIKSAMDCAWLNVLINTSTVDDIEFKLKAETEGKDILEESNSICNDTHAKILELYSVED